MRPRIRPAPSFARGVRRTRGAKARGLTYQRQVEEGLVGEIQALDLVAVIGPWIEYDGGRFCQPDIVCLPAPLAAEWRAIGEGRSPSPVPEESAGCHEVTSKDCYSIGVTGSSQRHEVTSGETPRAIPNFPRPIVIEAKLRHSPRAWTQLVELYGPLVEELVGVSPRLVEVTRSFDCATPWPEKPRLVKSLAEAPPRGVGILPWGFL